VQRNPVTGSGFAPGYRDSVVNPDRPRLLKAAADGVTVSDPHDRNPLTGDGMPLHDASIVDPKGRQQRRASTACGAGGGAFRSQFVIADDQGPAPEADGDGAAAAAAAAVARPGKRHSDAYDRMFHAPSTVIGIGDDAAESPEDSQSVENQQPTPTPRDADGRMFHSPASFILISSAAADPPQRPDEPAAAAPSTEKRSASDDEWERSRVSRKRHVPPPYREPHWRVLAWSKKLGSVDDPNYYIADQPSRRPGDARDSPSPITGEMSARTALDITDGSATCSDELPGDRSADDDDDYCWCFHSDDDDNDNNDDSGDDDGGDGDLSEAGEVGDLADRPHSS